MKCQDVRELLPNYYDWLLCAKDRHAVAEHLGTCKECAKLHLQLHQVSALANPVSVREAPASLSEKLLAAGLPLDSEAFAKALAHARGKMVPDILRDNLRGSGQVVFPGGEIANRDWEFGRLEALPSHTSD